MKEQSNELQTFLGRAANGVLRDNQDGDLNPLNDFSDYLPALLAAQPAFKGLNEYKGEKATETVAEKLEQLNILTREINAGSPETNHDLAHGLHGLQCLYSLGVRAGYESGVEAGRKLAVSEMASKKK